MEQTVESNTGLNTDIQSSEWPFTLEDLKEMIRLGESAEREKRERENRVVYILPSSGYGKSAWDISSGEIDINRLVRLRQKPDGTQIEEPPKRKRRRNGIEENEQTEEKKSVANVREQSQEERGFLKVFRKAVTKLADVCKNAPQNLPEGLTAMMAGKLGDSIETVTDFLMKLVKGSGKVPAWLGDIMKKTTNTNLSEKLLNNLSGLIGKNWKSLGLDLGLSSVEIDHISEENTGTLMKIFSMLRKWMNSRQEDATTSDLLLAMWNCKGLHVDWKRLANVFV